MESMDIQTREHLSPILEQAKPDNEQQQKRAQKLWKKTELPSTLLDTLNNLPKTELDPIRKNLQVKNASSLKKSELATLLANEIPSMFSEAVFPLDQERYDLLQQIVNEGGSIPSPDLSLEKMEWLKERSLVFPGLYNKQKVLFMPTELTDLFNEINGTELEKTIRRNTEWVRLTQGLLYYYGVMSEDFIIEKIQKLTGQAVDPAEFNHIISSASDYYGQVQITEHGLQDYRVVDPNRVIEEQSKNSDLDFFDFTKGQLLRAGKPGFVQKSSALNDLVNLLLKQPEITAFTGEQLAAQITYMINTDVQLTLIAEYVQSKGDLPEKVAQTLPESLKEVKNQTRLWDLKGHTINEITPPEEKNINPFPTYTLESLQQRSNDIHIKNLKKIGRNSPCPCGSGKKYKKCCMK
ncbi:SEC-C metal-binding domain-containing protein [Alkalihalobacterium sp. APHAB7]|uniref:YecA family protein n=1 Tax=Alkalihalobacterium sp. APHAB7 TaxID=3402081 RepID=UPI003AAF8FED